MELVRADLVAFLAERGIRAQSVRKLTTGERNLTLLIETPSGDRFVARQYCTASAGEVAYELAAIEFLAAGGFPTPAPVRSTDGDLAGQVGGRQAAVFRYAEGRHPDEPGTTGHDVGCQAAALAGRMHSLTRTADFPGHRTSRLDPLRRINEFLSGPHAAMPALRGAADSLAAHARTMTDLYTDAADFPQGLVHNDISAPNLLLDPRTGSITALIDFDDCMSSYLLYDLGQICLTWARDARGRVGRVRTEELIEAYSQCRPLTGRECRHAGDFIAAWVAATGIGFLTSTLRQGGRVTSPRDSIALSVFLQLRG